jgi:hypothetical protein
VSGLAARHGGRLGLAALVAILLLGLGLRLNEAWDGRAPVYDASAYAAIAANLEQGNGFTVGPHATQPSSNYSPGLPLLVAGLYQVTGGVHERLARVVLAVLGTLSVLFAYLIARRLTRVVRRSSPKHPGSSPPPHRARSSEVGAATGSARGALEGGPAEGKIQRALKNLRYWREISALAEISPVLVGTLVVAVYPALLEYQGMLMGEPLAATLLSGAVLAILWAADDWRFYPPRADKCATPRALARWMLAGALLGALALVRPEYLAVAVLIAVLVLLPGLRSLFVAHRARNSERSDWGTALAPAAALLAGLVVVLAPWTIRNAVALDRFVPVSTGGGQVLFAGTYLPSGGDPERVGEEVVARHPELFAPNAARNLRLEQILTRLAAHRYPGMESDRALSKMGKEQLWDDISEEPLEYLGFMATKVGRVWSHPARQVMRAPAWRILQWALVLCGLLGLGLLAWRRCWEALLLGTILLAITAISALLVASPRRVLVLLPLLAALAGVSLVWFTESLESASDGRHT